MVKLRKMSKTYYLRQIVACLLVYCILLAVPAQVAMATPSGGIFKVGAGTIVDGVQNSTVTVNQAQSVINWDSLDTSNTPLRETLTFLQSAGVTNAAVLNRVIAGGATQFNGELSAVGMDIFIVNTRGIVFGPDSYVQARNLVASGIDIQNIDFITKNYQFARFTPTTENPSSNVIGNVMNEGIGTGPLHGINAENVALIGQNVTNKGIIRTTALGGAVVMAAGESVFLNEVGSNVVVQVAMTDPALHVVDNGGSQGTGTGTIEAPSGKVILAAGDIYSTAISGLESLRAEANRDIIINDNIQAGEIAMEAGRDISLGGIVEASGTGGTGDISLMTTTGDITVADVRALDDQITINSGGAIREFGGDLAADLTADTLDMTADVGIGTLMNSIETAATTITARTIDPALIWADIILHNDNSSPTSLTASTVGTDSWVGFSQTGGGELTLTDVSTVDGQINISADSVDIVATLVNAGGQFVYMETINSGDITVDNITANSYITITSAGAILENVGGDAAADLTAATLTLTADTGITGQSPIETSATDITATTVSGDIDIANTNGSATTASLAVTTGDGTILFSQSGGGSLDVTSATTADGSIGIDVDNANLTAQTVTADGVDVDDNVSLTTTTSGDVIVDDITAVGNTITIDSAGAIAEDGSDPAADLTADTLDLTANEAIGSTGNPIETAATTIIASTIDPASGAADIVLDNDNSSSTSLTASTVGTDSYVVFNQTGGGELTLTDVSTVDGLINISAEAGNIVATLVNAGGPYDITLSTTTSGDISVGSVTADDDQITINSAGAIAEDGSDPAADLTADTLDLTADEAIGSTGNPIETAATTIIASTIDPASGAADIVLDNYNISPTSLTASTVGTDSYVVFNQTGGGELTLTDVSTVDGLINISAEAGNIVATLVNAGGTYDISLSTTTSGDITVGSVTADDDQITINSAGAIDNEGAVDGTANAVGGVIDLTANSGGIGQSTTLEVTATTALNADTTADGSNIDIDSIGDLPVGLVDAGTGDVTLDSTGNIMGVTNDGVADVVGSTINLTAAVGGIGNALEVTASTALNADATADGSNIDIDSIGDLPVGLVDAAGGDVTLNSDSAIRDDVDDSGAPAVDVVGDTINLTAVSGGIGTPAGVDGVLEVTAATALNADTTADGSNINIDSIGDLPVGLVDAAGGDVTLNSDSAIRDDVDDSGAPAVDVVGDTINLTAVSGGIGTLAGTVDGVLEVTAATALNADTTADSANINIDSIGDLPVGLVDAAGGDVTLNSDSAINDASDDIDVDIIANMLTLSAVDEIGGSPTAGTATDTLGAIETTVTSLDATSTTAGDIVIVETDDVDLNDIIATSGSIYLEATLGGMTHVGGTIEAGSSTLTLVQQNDLDLAGFTFANQANTDLMVEITDGGFTTVDTANGGNDDNAADQWQSIQALAKNNIVLQGSDADEDIKIGTHAGFDPLSHPFGGVVESSEGGVSIISDNHTVRTADDTILDNVAITGTSDDELDIGVDLPYGPGKAAIVIMGAEDLMLGENVELTASGTYDTTGDVDDREGLGLLDVRTEIPDGFPRYEGDPFDAAIYLASTDGDVDVSAAVSIMSSKIEDALPVIVPEGAMVIDAYDTVTFDESGILGGAFEDSLENGDVGDRLEVVSRITEWLFQAVDHLPYPSYPYNGVGPFPAGYTYVLRGAGLDNPAITDGRAWVLVDPDNAPLDREAGEKAQMQALGLDGCPILLAVVSAELGIPEETIEVSLANSYALNTDVQPCESCARLIDAAAILADVDGSAMAAMNQVFNALAPANAPYTPEVATSIVTAFAGHINDGSQYATAIEYIDAFVNYIAVLNSDLGSPVGDSLAYTMQKYGSGVTGSDNANMAAFVASRLETGETFDQ